MKKNDVILIFGSVPNISRALHVGYHAVYMWHPENDLPRVVADRVLGAAFRLDITIPDEILPRLKAE